MKQELTIIITANLIPSHPDIYLVKEVIDSLNFLGINHEIRIILAHDNIHPEVLSVLSKSQQRYDEYFKNLQYYINNNCKYKYVDILLTKEWGHLTRNVKHAIDHIATPYFLLLQHDLPFIREVSISNALDIFKHNPFIHHLRFNHRKNLPTGWDGNSSKCIEMFKEIKTDLGPICKTLGWSDRNHISSTQHYIDVVFPDCSIDTRTSFMEVHLNNTNKKNPDRYGTYIYDGYGSEAYIKSTNGAHTFIPDFIFDEQYCIEKYPELFALAKKPNNIKNIYVDKFGHTSCMKENFNWEEYSKLKRCNFKSPNLAYQHFKKQLEK